MPVFARSFVLDNPSIWVAKNPLNVVRSLFDRWALPGTEATDDASLRLGVRNGYVNFYIKGQSVAKLSSGRGGLTLSVHNAYVNGYVRSPKRGGNLPNYVPYDAMALADPAAAGLVDGWIKTAETYASAEKRFVDDLIAANPGIIDLEMALPASELPGSKRVAPRMDIVIAECADGAETSIAFWEAKCANNAELRASEDRIPKVLGQIDRYVGWMSEAGRVAQVAQAYRDAAATLIELHGLFRGTDDTVPECVRIWQALAASEAPAIRIQPGIVIGNYWPEGSTEGIASDRMAQAAASFERNGHRDRLEQHGIRVHEVVAADDKGVVLPVLPGEVATA